ncbi:MAG TPA: NADP-dependent oxidoreductase [Ktedonobacter sp.]|jgi:NADPH:quinone reductase-like Zn-dependent oxidoreductase|nr:NADP-dependent oxidoreductase [Ktedonobacter sp.]HCP74865.1 NADP-dependent oxidoreductase [Ktedonobacter sp.]
MSTQTKQAIRVHNYGDADQLKLEEEQRPEPQAGEVLIRVYAAGVNPVDWKIRQGWMKDFRPQQLPYLPGIDLAGVVEEVGPGVTAFQKGQAVFGQSAKGAYTEYTTASVETLALKPKTLSFDEAATIPVGATTAWQGLFDHGKLQAGQRVLIQGAAGGVGLFAVQFARWKGAHVTGTASAANADFVRSAGAETVVDYTTTAVEKAVHDMDLVFDTVGAKTLDSSLQVVKRGGTLVTIAGQPSEEKVKERGIYVASYSARVSSALLQTFAQLVDEGQIKVAIAATFPLRDAWQAHELSQSGHGRGRIVLHIAE